jgi:hypothetical protein
VIFSFLLIAEYEWMVGEARAEVERLERGM